MPYRIPWRLTSLCTLDFGNERHLMLVVKRPCDELATEGLLCLEPAPASP